MKKTDYKSFKRKLSNVVATPDTEEMEKRSKDDNRNRKNAKLLAQEAEIFNEYTEEVNKEMFNLFSIKTKANETKKDTKEEIYKTMNFFKPEENNAQAA